MGYLYNRKETTKTRRRLRNEMPKAEQVLWRYLRKRQINSKKFRRQYGILGYTVDFYCPELKLAIEVDGDTHQSSSERKHDTERDAFIRAQGIHILRFTNLEIYQDLEYVLEDIERNTTPSNSPL